MTDWTVMTYDQGEKGRQDKKVRILNLFEILKRQGIEFKYISILLGNIDTHKHTYTHAHTYTLK